MIKLSYYIYFHVLNIHNKNSASQKSILHGLMSIILFLSFGSFYTHTENKRRVDIDWFHSLASVASTWGRPRDRIAPNGRYGGRELWFGQHRVYRSISSPEKALSLSNAFVPSPRPHRRPSVYEWATVVRSWPSFCEWQRRHFLRFEVVWGCFSCLENVAVILDFRAAFIVVYRCLSDLESSSIRFEAVAANTLGIPSFWGCLRRTQSLAGGWKFQWTAAKSSDMSIQLLFD